MRFGWSRRTIPRFRGHELVACNAPRVSRRCHCLGNRDERLSCALQPFSSSKPEGHNSRRPCRRRGRRRTTVCAEDSAGLTVRETAGLDCGWGPYRPSRQDESQRCALVSSAQRDSEVGLTPLNLERDSIVERQCSTRSATRDSVVKDSRGTLRFTGGSRHRVRGRRLPH
jgi:hypothetical protein